MTAGPVSSAGAEEEVPEGPGGHTEAASAEQLAQHIDDPWAGPWALVSPASSQAGPTAQEAPELMDGTYSASALGMDGLITVTIQVKDGTLTCTRIEQEGETQSMGGYEAIRHGVYAALIDRAQGPGFDGIADATVTSMAVQSAVEKAMEKAAAGEADQQAPEAGGAGAGSSSAADAAEGTASDAAKSKAADTTKS